MAVAPRLLASLKINFDPLLFRHINNGLRQTRPMSITSTAAYSHLLLRVMATGRDPRLNLREENASQMRRTNIPLEHLRLQTQTRLTSTRSFVPQMRLAPDL